MVKFFSTSTTPSEEEMQHDNVHIFCVQGHPEFTKGIVETVARSRVEKGILTAEYMKDVERRLDWRNDGILIGKVIWKILGVA